MTNLLWLPHRGERDRGKRRPDEGGAAKHDGFES